MAYSPDRVALIASPHPTKEKTWDFKLSYASRSTRGLLEDTFSSRQEEDLRWLLEDHATKDPFSKQRAQDVNLDIKLYGEMLFAQLYAPLQEIIPQGRLETSANPIYLQISGCGDELSIHSLHWEALELVQDPEIFIIRVVDHQPPGSLVVLEQKGHSYQQPKQHHIIDTGILEDMLLTQQYLFGTSSSKQDVNQRHAIKGRLNAPSRDQNLKPGIPIREPKPFRILFITARDLGEDDLDISYRLVSKLAFRAVKALSQPGKMLIDFVRPGTWESLQEALNEKDQGYYDMVHFDVHGKVLRNKAFLYFNSSDDIFSTTRVLSSKVGKMLADRKVRVALLNACESAKASNKIDKNLAATFIREGVPSVIGMSYQLLVSSASVFVPEFYKQLVRNSNNVAEAVRHTRCAMALHRTRQAILDTRIEIPDMINPVFYQRREFEAEFQTQSEAFRRPLSSNVSYDQMEEDGVLGRDLDILRLETTLLTRSSAIELIGAFSSGRTAFLKHAVDWWQEVGFVHQVHWIDGSHFQKDVEQLLQDLSVQLCSQSPQRPNSKNTPQSLIVLDHAEHLLEGWKEESRAKLRAFLLRQNAFCVTTTTGRQQSTLRLPVSHLLPLNKATARDIAVATLPRKSKVSLSDEKDSHYLERCVWLLDCNPHAIKLAFSTIKFKSFRQLFHDLQILEHDSPFLKHLSKCRIVDEIKSLFNQLDSAEEKSIMLALSQARLRIPKNPESLINELVRSKNLPITALAFRDRDRSDPTTNYVDFLISTMMHSKEGKKMPDEEKNLLFLSFNPYRSHFSTIAKLLESNGFASSNNEYWDLHPLFPYALSAIGFKENKRLTHSLHAAFHESYHHSSRNWSRRMLVELWGAKKLELFPSTGPIGRVMASLKNDFANYSGAIRRQIDQGCKDWAARFPWNILISMGVHYCSILGADVLASETTVVVDFLTDYLHTFNKISSFRHGMNLGKAIAVSAGFGQEENGGPQMGATMALIASLCLTRHYSFGLDGSLINFHWRETTRLWIHFLQFYSMLAEDPATIDLISMIMYVRGFLEFQFSWTPDTRVVFIDYIMNNFSESVRLIGRLEKRYDDGNREAQELALMGFAVSKTEFEEAGIDENSDHLGSVGNATLENSAEQILHEAKDSTINLNNQLQRVDLQNAGVEFPSRPTQTERRDNQPDPSWLHDTLRTAKLVQQMEQNNVDGLIKDRLVIAQRMMLRRENKDALEQFQVIRKLLLDKQPKLSKPNLKAKDKDGIFYCQVLVLEANVLRELGNKDEEKRLLLMLREMCSFKENSLGHRQSLLCAYMGLEGQGLLSMMAEPHVDLEKMRWVLEYGCLRFDRTISAVGPIAEHVMRTVKVFQAEDIFGPDDGEDPFRPAPDGSIFTQVYFGGLIFLSGDQLRLRPEIDKVALLCFKMMHTSNGGFFSLFHEVGRLIFIDREEMPPDAVADDRFRTILTEAERVLFGDMADVVGLQYLKKFERMPLRKYFPWQSLYNWSIGAERLTPWLAKKQNSALIMKAKS